MFVNSDSFALLKEKKKKKKQYMTYLQLEIVLIN